MSLADIADHKNHISDLHHGHAGVDGNMSPTKGLANSAFLQFAKVVYQSRLVAFDN
jgi:hypothetical protein